MSGARAILVLLAVAAAMLICAPGAAGQDVSIDEAKAEVETARQLSAAGGRGGRGG